MTPPTTNNVITFGNARFSIMANNLIRAEYAENKDFLDAPTLSVAQRVFHEAEVNVSENGDEITIETPEIKLWHRRGSAGFTESNLKISFQSPGGSGEWSYGQDNPGLMPGTLRTVDMFDGAKHVTKLDRDESGNFVVAEKREEPFIPGYISRSGYTVYNDAKSIPLTATNDKGEPWVAPLRDGVTEDIYFAAYGDDFYRGLRTVSQFYGKQPIPPRFSLGLWFSRYWEFTDQDLEGIVEDHNRRNVPLDVLVIDMDWHKLGWTGYSWDETFFPDPADTLAYLQSKGVKITMNLHPADGVAKHEDQYEDFCLEMGVDPASGETIPFDCTDPKYMDAYFRLLHHPCEDQGVRFWWMDWQQGQKSQIEGLDPLPWLNELHWRDLATRFPERRPMIFSRFGGPGAGRFPVGFSGDSLITWDSLAFQPYFTATAANVCYGYWSHDIGGHHIGESYNAELYTRWVQYSVLSPIVRLHHSKTTQDHRLLWNYERPYQDHLFAAIDRRYALLPYISSELVHAHHSDTSLCMPMYYEYPESKDAFEAKDQYFFGRTFLAAPVCKPVEEQSGLAKQRIWIPEGEWVDLELGVTHTGPKWIEEDYTLAQIPTFAKAGSLWVEQSPKLRTNEGSFADLEIVALGGANGETMWTEDDGESLGYQSDGLAKFNIAQEFNAGVTRISLEKVGDAQFDGFVAERPVRLRLQFRKPPQSISLNGVPLSYQKRGGAKSWSYVGDRLEVIIDAGVLDLAAGFEVTVQDDEKLDGVDISDFVRRQACLTHAWSYGQRGAHHANLTPYQRSLPRLVQAGRRITHFPETFAEEMKAFAKMWSTIAEDQRKFCEIYDEATKGNKKASIKLQEQALAVLETCP